MKYQKKCTELITDLLIEAGDILKKLFYTSTEITEKSPKDYVTEADILIDNFLKAKLPKIIPSVSIYSEEQNSELIEENQWIIDPVDGTANFILGIPHFAISIAFIENSQVIAGFVYNPLTKELFWTDPWNNAMLNNDRITVSNRIKLVDMYGLFGFSANYKNITKYETEWNELFSKSKKALGILSPSLSICCVAKGKADFFIDFGCSPEGKVAAIEILRKAGGHMYNYNKDDYTVNSVGVIATNSTEIFLTNAST